METEEFINNLSDSQLSELVDKLFPIIKERLLLGLADELFPGIKERLSLESESTVMGTQMKGFGNAKKIKIVCKGTEAISINNPLGRKVTSFVKTKTSKAAGVSSQSTNLIESSERKLTIDTSNFEAGDTIEGVIF